MQFPMNLTDRIALIAVADELASLKQRSAELGLDFLALLINRATEEACDHLEDDTLARLELDNRNQRELDLVVDKSVPDR